MDDKPSSNYIGKGQDDYYRESTEAAEMERQQNIPRVQRREQVLPARRRRQPTPEANRDGPNWVPRPSEYYRDHEEYQLAGPVEAGDGGDDTDSAGGQQRQVRRPQSSTSTRGGLQIERRQLDRLIQGARLQVRSSIEIEMPQDGDEHQQQDERDVEMEDADVDAESDNDNAAHDQAPDALAEAEADADADRERRREVDQLRQQVSTLIGILGRRNSRQEAQREQEIARLHGEMRRLQRHHEERHQDEVGSLRNEVQRLVDAVSGLSEENTALQTQLGRQGLGLGLGLGQGQGQQLEAALLLAQARLDENYRTRDAAAGRQQSALMAAVCAAFPPREPARRPGGAGRDSELVLGDFITLYNLFRVFFFLNLVAAIYQALGYRGYSNRGE